LAIKSWKQKKRIRQYEVTSLAIVFVCFGSIAVAAGDLAQTINNFAKRILEYSFLANNR
jgi:hypothetical protein